MIETLPEKCRTWPWKCYQVHLK